MGCARVLRLERNKEARHPATRRWDWFDPDSLLRHFDAVVHGGLVVGEQIEALNNRLDARAAQDLLLHRRQTRLEIFSDDGLHIIFRNLLLLYQYQRLRHVLRRHDIAYADTNRKEKDRASQNQPESPLQYPRVVLHCHFTMPEHTTPS